MLSHLFERKSAHHGQFCYDKSLLRFVLKGERGGGAANSSSVEQKVKTFCKKRYRTAGWTARCNSMLITYANRCRRRDLVLEHGFAR